LRAAQGGVRKAPGLAPDKLVVRLSAERWEIVPHLSVTRSHRAGIGFGLGLQVIGFLRVKALGSGLGGRVGGLVIGSQGLGFVRVRVRVRVIGVSGQGLVVRG